MRKLSFTTARAMRVAQQLYEGMDVGSGTVGLITYMRTDSFNMSTEAIMQIRNYVKKNFDADYLPKSPIMYKTKSKAPKKRMRQFAQPISPARLPAYAST